MVQIDNLTFSYNQKQPLFDGLNITLSPGHIYGLLGKNGAGKSSLLKIISGLLFPGQGTVSVLGHEPKHRYPKFMQEVYLIPEEFELPPLTLERFVRLYSPFYPRFSHLLFDGYVAEFQLTTDQRLSTLSYGQKKKFLLSFGLATDCKLVILDEPTNGLDIPSKSQFRKVVASAIHDERTFVISTHQVRDMEALIDPIIILDEGKVVFFEDCERVSEKLTITRLPKLPTDREPLYADPSFGGYTIVEENTTLSESNINLEILFKAVVGNKEKFYELFKR